MFTDTFTVSRFTAEIDPNDGTESQGSKPTPVEGLIDLDGRASYKEVPVVDLSSNVVGGEKNIVLFTMPNVDIRLGDSVEIKRMDDDGTVMETIVGRLGKPNTYPSHKEVMLTEYERA